jgi:hypothetical protein
MALIICFVNKSHLAEVSDYNVEVLVGDGSATHSHTIYRGEVKGHTRSDGWQKLVQKMLNEQEVNHD